MSLAYTPAAYDAYGYPAALPSRRLARTVTVVAFVLALVVMTLGTVIAYRSLTSQVTVSRFGGLVNETIPDPAGVGRGISQIFGTVLLSFVLLVTSALGYATDQR